MRRTEVEEAPGPRRPPRRLLVLAAVLTLTAGGLLSACGGSASDSGSGGGGGKPAKIALVLPGPNTYFDPWGDAAKDAAAKYGFEASYEVPPTQKFELTQQNRLVDSLVSQGYNGFGLFPGDAEGTNTQEQKLKSRGIPSVNINGCTNDPSPALFCVSTDVYAAAEYQTQQLIKAIGGKGDIAVLTSQLTDPNTQLRIEAAKAVVAKTNGDVKIVQIVADIDTPDSAPPAINSLLAGRGSTLDGALSTSYYPSAAMATALTDNAQYRKIKFIACCNIPSVMKAVQNRYITGTLFQNTYGMAYVGAYSLFKVIQEGCKVSPSAPFDENPQTKKLIAAGVALITPEDVDQYIGKPESLPDDTERMMKLVDDKILEC